MALGTKPEFGAVMQEQLNQSLLRGRITFILMVEWFKSLQIKHKAVNHVGYYFHSGLNRAVFPKTKASVNPKLLSSMLSASTVLRKGIKRCFR